MRAGKVPEFCVLVFSCEIFIGQISCREVGCVLMKLRGPGISVWSLQPCWVLDQSLKQESVTHLEQVLIHGATAQCTLDPAM